MSGESKGTRRSFLTTSAAIAGGAMLGAAATRDSARQENRNDRPCRVEKLGQRRDPRRTDRHRRALPAPDGRRSATIPGVRITAVCDVYDPHLAEGKKLAEANAFATKKYQEILDQQGHRRGADRHARPLARADDGRRVRGRQGRVRRKAAHARSVGRPRGRRSTEQAPPHRAGRHAAAEHAAHREGGRADQGRPPRRGPQGQAHVEPQHRPRAPRPRHRRSQAGRLEGVPRQRTATSRSTSTGCGTGAGSGISAAASSPT